MTKPKRPRRTAPHILAVRMTAEERDAVRDAAAHCNETIAEWVRAGLMRLVAEQQK